MKALLLGIFREPGDPDGNLSFGRVASGLLVLFVMFWISWHWLHFHQPPEHIGDLSVLAVSPYGANKVPTKISEMIAALKGKSE